MITNKQYAALAVAAKVEAGSDYFGLIEEEKDDFTDSSEEEFYEDREYLKLIDFDIFTNNDILPPKVTHRMQQRRAKKMGLEFSDDGSSVSTEVYNFDVIFDDNSSIEDKKNQITEKVSIKSKVGISKKSQKGHIIDGKYSEGSNYYKLSQQTLPYLARNSISTKPADLIEDKEDVLKLKEAYEDENLENENFEDSPWLPPSIERALEYKQHWTYGGGTLQYNEADIRMTKELGLGIPLYFSFLWSMTCCFMIMSILSLPTLFIYWSGGK